MESETLPGKCNPVSLMPREPFVALSTEVHSSRPKGKARVGFDFAADASSATPPEMTSADVAHAADRINARLEINWSGNGFRRPEATSPTAPEAPLVSCRLVRATSRCGVADGGGPASHAATVEHTTMEVIHKSEFGVSEQSIFVGIILILVNGHPRGGGVRIFSRDLSIFFNSKKDA